MIADTHDSASSDLSPLLGSFLNISEIERLSPGRLRGKTWIYGVPFLAEFIEVQNTPEEQRGADSTAVNRLMQFDAWFGDPYEARTLTLPNYPGDWILVIYPEPWRDYYEAIPNEDADEDEDAGDAF